MISRAELYIKYLQDAQWEAQMVLRQSDFNTAQGNGLERIAKAIKIQGRTVDAAGFEETDVSLRQRIIRALEAYE